MKKVAWFTLVGLIGLAGCSPPPDKEKESTQLLVSKDKSCATHADQASCTADSADGCQWFEVTPVACPANDPGDCTPPGTASGICQGQADGNQCVVADQCGRLNDQASCGAQPSCAWVPGACAEPVDGPSGGPDEPADGGTFPCPAFVCQPINPCQNLDVKNCSSNPSCMLQEEQSCTGSGPCPAYSCPDNEPNCPPPTGDTCDMAPPTCTTTTLCVLQPVVCGGSDGSAGTPTPLTGEQPL